MKLLIWGHASVRLPGVLQHASVRLPGVLQHASVRLSGMLQTNVQHSKFG